MTERYQSLQGFRLPGEGLQAMAQQPMGADAILAQIMPNISAGYQATPVGMPPVVQPSQGFLSGFGKWAKDSGFTGRRNPDGSFDSGWGGLALGGASALMQGFMGLKQYGMAKDQMNEGRRQFDLNYGAQRDLINTQLEDRARARASYNPGHYEPVESYMDRNRIK